MVIKPGVDCRGVHSKVWEALWIMSEIYNEHGKELVITSLREGKHSKKRSKHYDGLAADTRIRYFNTVTLTIVYRKIKQILGVDYVVVLEKDHIHMHWAPVYHDAS